MENAKREIQDGGKTRKSQGEENGKSWRKRRKINEL